MPQNKLTRRDPDSRLAGAAQDPYAMTRGLARTLIKTLPQRYGKYKEEDFINMLEKISKAETQDQNIRQLEGGPGRGYFQMELTSAPYSLERAKNNIDFLKEQGVPLPKLPKLPRYADDFTQLTKDEQAFYVLNNMIGAVGAKMKQGKTSEYLNPKKPKQMWLNYHWAGSQKDKPDRIKHWDETHGESSEDGESPYLTNKQVTKLANTKFKPNALNIPTYTTEGVEVWSDEMPAGKRDIMMYGRPGPTMRRANAIKQAELVPTPKFAQGGEVTKSKNPTVVINKKDRAYYDPISDTIFMNEQESHNPTIYPHELYHSWQAKAGDLQVPEYLSGPIRRPAAAIRADNPQNEYYNRRAVDEGIIANQFLQQNPSFNFVNPDLLLNKAVEPSMYKRPWTAEGEAEAFGNSFIGPSMEYAKGGLIKRKDGSYSKRGLWDNIRANRGSGRKPTAEMLRQERKIRAAEKKEDGGWLDSYAEGGETNPLMNIPESQRFPQPVNTTVTYPEGYWEDKTKVQSSVPLNFMGEPYATGAIEESISPLDFIGGVRGATGLVKGYLNYRKAAKSRLIPFGDSYVDLGRHPKSMRRAMQQMHKGGREILIPSPFAEGGQIENQKIPDTTAYEFGNKFIAYPDPTLTNYQMGTPKAPMYAAGATVWTDQDTPTWAAGSTTPTATQNFRNTGSLNTNNYRIGDVIPTGMDYKTPAAGTYDYNKDIQPPKQMRLYAPQKWALGGAVGAPFHHGDVLSKKNTYNHGFANGGYVPMYKSGGFFRQAGEFAFGALEGTLDTVTGGMTDSLTDMAHDSLAKAAGTTYEGKEGQRLKRLHGAGKIGGAITGGIVSGNVAGAIGQGAEGTNDILQASPNASDSLKQWGGMGLNLAQMGSGFMGGSLNNSSQMASFGNSGIGQFSQQAGKIGQGYNQYGNMLGDPMSMMSMFMGANGGYIPSKKRAGIPYAISPGISNEGMYVGPTTQRGITFADGGDIMKVKPMLAAGPSAAMSKDPRQPNLGVVGMGYAGGRYNPYGQVKGGLRGGSLEAGLSPYIKMNRSLMLNPSIGAGISGEGFYGKAGLTGMYNLPNNLNFDLYGSAEYVQDARGGSLPIEAGLAWSDTSPLVRTGISYDPLQKTAGISMNIPIGAERNLFKYKAKPKTKTRFADGGDTTNARESTYVKPVYKQQLVDEDNPVEVAEALMKKHNVTIDSTGNMLEDIGLPSNAYYNPITRTINYKNPSHVRKDWQDEAYARIIATELPHAVQADSLGTIPFLYKVAKEGLNLKRDAYSTPGTIEHEAHSILEPKFKRIVLNTPIYSPMLHKMRKNAVEKKAMGGQVNFNNEKQSSGWLDKYQEGGETPQQYAYRTIAPTGFLDPKNYYRYATGTSRDTTNTPMRSADELAWKKYLGLNQNEDFPKSQAKPSKSTDKSATYYTLNPEDNDELLQLLSVKMKNMPDTSFVINENDVARKYAGAPINPFSVLQDFTIGKGRDDKGTYISYYDIYDFDKALEPMRSKLESLGTPYEFYNKYYYPNIKDKYGKTLKYGDPEYNEYYGPDNAVKYFQPNAPSKKAQGGWLDKYDSGSTVKKGFKTYSSDPEYFNSRAVLSDNPKWNENLKQLIYSGKVAYNPSTGETQFIKSQAAPSDVQQMATKEYTEGVRRDPTDPKFAGADARTKQIIGQSTNEAYQNPLMYTPGMIGISMLPGGFQTAIGLSSGAANIGAGNYKTGALEMGLSALPFIPKLAPKVLKEININNQLNKIKTEGISQGLSEYEIAKRQMEKVGITSNQRKAYTPIISELAEKYIKPRNYTGTEASGQNKFQEVIENIKKGGYKEAYPERIDAWRLYLGRPQINKTFSLANTAPVMHPSYKPGSLKGMDIYNIKSENTLDNINFPTNYITGTTRHLKLLDNPISISRDNSIMGGYNRVLTKEGAQYNDIWDLQPTITFKSLFPKTISENSKLENIFYKTYTNGVQHPRGFKIPVEKFVGKPFMSHGNLSYTSTDHVNRIKDRILGQINELERSSTAHSKSERLAELYKDLKELENYPKFKQGGLVYNWIPNYPRVGVQQYNKKQSGGWLDNM